jgi:hypothetical protein
LRDLITIKSDPEAAIVRAFQKLFITVRLSDQVQAGHGSADFMITTKENNNIILEFKKYLYYDRHDRTLKHYNLNPFLNTKEMMNIKEQIFEYLDDPNATWRYLVLTNMQDWYFYSRSDLTTKRKLKPFAVKTLKEVFDRFGDEFTVLDLERLEVGRKKGIWAKSSLKISLIG